MQRKIFLAIAFCLTAFSLATISGCGNGNVPLTGHVRFGDGKPLTGGTVYFIKQGFQASGNLDSNGKFVLGSAKTGDGLPEGEYAVYIGGANPQEDSGKITWIIPEKYESENTSGLSCVVTSATKNFDIVLERP